MTWKAGHDLYLSCGVCGAVLSTATDGPADRSATMYEWNKAHAVCRERALAVNERDDERPECHTEAADR